MGSYDGAEFCVLMDIFFYSKSIKNLETISNRPPRNTKRQQCRYGYNLKPIKARKNII